MPQPHPCGMSGGCRAAQGTGISELFQILDIRIALLLFPGVADLLRSKSTSANAVRGTLAFLDSSFGVIQDYFFCAALPYNDVGMETK